MRREQELLSVSYVAAQQLHSSLTQLSHLSGISNQSLELARRLSESLRTDTRERQA